MRSLRMARLRTIDNLYQIYCSVPVYYHTSPIPTRMHHTFQAQTECCNMRLGISPAVRK